MPPKETREAGKVLLAAFTDIVGVLRRSKGKVEASLQTDEMQDRTFHLIKIVVFKEEKR